MTDTDIQIRSQLQMPNPLTIEHVEQSLARIGLAFCWPWLSGFEPASISQARTYRH